MSSATRSQIRLALNDLVVGTWIWRTWYVLGVSELRQKYRRTMLGPFWVTLAVGIQAFVMGFLLSYLFQADVNRQLPFLCISLVTWTFLSAVINEGANCFVGMSSVILQVRRPLWTYVMLILWRNAIIYAHTIAVFIIAALIFKIYPSANYFLIPLGLGILVANVAWMALVAGILSARYRDVSLLLTNLFTVLVWTTPVYYPLSMLGPKTRTIIELNPLTHIMDVARGPFLNEVPPLSVWVIALTVAIFGWMLALGLFARTRARIPYWL